MNRLAFSKTLPLLAALALLTVDARADVADDAFNRGMKELGSGRYDAACDAFEEAEQHSGATMKTRYQLGRCNQELKNYVAAYRAFADVERLASDAGDDKRAAAARQRMNEVAKHFGLLTIDVPEATASLPGLTINRDGEPVPPHDFGRPVAVEPGPHVIVVSADDHQTLELKASPVAAGETSGVGLPALAAGSGQTSSEVDPTPTGGAGGPPPAAESDGPGRASPALFWTGLGFVIAGPLVVAGSVYTYVEEEERETGIAGMVIGGALLAVGIPFMIVGGADAEPESQAITLQPQVGPGWLGLSGQF